MLAAHLKNILVDKALVTPTTSGSVMLREPGVMKVEVAEIPPDFTAIDMRKIGSLSGLRDGEWKQVCDYLMVCEAGGVVHAIFAELKKTLNHEKKPREQLRRSRPILKYLYSMCAIHYGVEVRKSDLSVQYLLIFERTSKRLAKQGVRAAPRRKLSQERHENITVSTFVGPRIPLTLLLER